jgi:tRNA 2-thiouridine synthesizing protein A
MAGSWNDNPYLVSYKLPPVNSMEVLVKRWEAGELGCGQLVFELRRQLDGVDPGDDLEVVTHEPGAPVDLPAWCRMTGHTLVSAEHPTYVIRRKTD